MEEGGKRKEEGEHYWEHYFKHFALCSMLSALCSLLLPLSSFLLYIRFDIRKRRAVSTGIPRRLA